ncbi:hypothetical protein [Polyangium aurulentum]|uniref:hypothetical protein n=1 Tax=Polyangium aurulentum TaxID=2567896 RepID=UPI0010AE806D|nr:hypothetical protein [Polyangium aurulentum]UQA58612.1 hypothetical protein E8A73_046485 [Polyangium aurulentum]
MRFLVTVGYFDASSEGRLVEIDLERGTQRPLLAYVPPEPLRVPEKGFTGAAWSGRPGASTLFVCGSSAVYQVDPRAWSVTAIWHQRCMNDLHHVAVEDDRVYVVNTGLEAIDVFSLDGLFLGSHALHPGWLSAARQGGFSPARDALPALIDARWPHRTADVTASEPPLGDYYTPREPASAAPFSRSKVRDYIHPNHVTSLDGRLLVTRFIDRAVDDVTTYRRVIADTPGLPHDGLVDGDRFWITCVNGLVIAYAIEGGRVTGREVERIDVFATGHSGWCRGLAVTPGHVIVGLTAIRRMPRYRWCDRPFEETETSVLAIERATGKLARRVELDGEGRHPKIFSVLPL